MFPILLSFYFGYNNSRLAKLKGQNVTIWVIITILAFFFATIIGGMIVTFGFYRGPIEQVALTEFLQNPIRIALIYACGIGGYLLMRYLLERMPDQPITTVNNSEEEE